LLSLIPTDQRRRWLRGERVTIEDYLDRFPHLRESPDILLDLIYSEACLREEMGAAADWNDYYARFPGLADALKRQHEVHRAMADATLKDLDRLCSLAPSADSQPMRGVGDTAHDLPLVPGYDIDSEVGRGGMGIVYRARHLKLNRIVALKMVRGGAHADAEQLVRFLKEAEVLAQIQHPGVVQVFETGTIDGRPYLAIEFCPGGSLAQKLRDAPLGARNAAMLVQGLARAIQVIHDKGIIHRDLKPANVLFAEDGTPKITDFGLAKVVGSDMTMTGSILGSPAYMAPEQADEKCQDIDGRVDLYSLGVILYECLTGRPPFRGATILETLDQVRHQTPVAPSRLTPKVPRNLETICLKCLQKSPRKRYDSAKDLSDDLGRFLGGEPIRARPVGSIERAWRWCRRKPLAATLLVALAIVLTGSMVGLTLMWQQATTGWRHAVANEAQARAQKHLADDQRAEAEAAADKANRLSEILIGMFEANDPLGVSGTGAYSVGAGSDLKAQELLERGAAKLARTELPPLTRALIQDRIGTVFISLGRLDEAAPLLLSALRIRQEQHGPLHQEVADSLHQMGRLEHLSGDYARAEHYYRAALDMRWKLGSDELDSDPTEFSLAWTIAEDLRVDEAEKLFRTVLDRRIRLRGPDHRDVAVVRLAVAAVLLEKRHYVAALEQARLARDIVARNPDAGPIVQATGLFQEAVVASFLLKRPAEAERKLAECLSVARKALGDRHIYLVPIYIQLAISNVQLKHWDDAEKNYRAAFDIIRSTGSPSHPQLGRFLEGYGSVLIKNGKLTEVDRLWEEFVRATQKRFGQKHRATADALTRYADYLFQRGRRDDEANTLLKAVDAFRADPEPQRRPLYLFCLRDLSSSHMNRNRPEAAVPLLREAVAIAQARHGSNDMVTGEMQTQLATALLDLGRFDQEVEELLSAAKKSLPSPSLIGSGSPMIPDVYHNLSRLHRLRKEPQPAAAAARRFRSLASQPGEFVTAARDLALTAKLLGDGSDDRRALLDDAMRALNQAKAKGHRNLAALRDDTDFALLRDRPEFLKLVGGK
jgi:tetratricopeptide (TPR) repeat protein